MPSPDAPGAAGPLLGILRARIAREGPLPLDAYMQACAVDPLHGYWSRPSTIGRSGDFVTAPEISQVFGELTGLWCAVSWQSIGCPSPLRLVELGPGRGALLRDALRAVRVVPGFVEAVDLHLIEASGALREIQRRTLEDAAASWHETIADVPSGPAIVIGNEFLDALPIRQLVFAER